MASIASNFAAMALPKRASSMSFRANAASRARLAAPRVAPTRAGTSKRSRTSSLRVVAEERLNIVMVGAECAPFSKTGGLGDVMASLPKALVARGHRVMAVIPMYYHYDECGTPCGAVDLNICGEMQHVDYFHHNRDGVDLVFVSHPAFYENVSAIYGGGTMGVTWRGALLSQAAIEAVWHVPCGGFPFGTDNLIYVANDWHTAILPVYLRAFYQDHQILGYARSCLIVHNIAHQGRTHCDDVWRLNLPDHHTGAFYLDDPMEGPGMNVLKAGIEYATKVIAVSPGYAWEIGTDEGGWGLAPTIRNDPVKVSGIVNGIDFNEWSPEMDPYLQSDGYQTYGTNLEGWWTGKQACKAALQRQLGLEERHDVPLLGFIGRLDEQKGIDLILNSEEFLMSQDVQIVFLGSGRQDLQDRLHEMECRNRHAVRAWIGFSNEMAHRITAGCDILLMPSRFEPCGLNQLYAMHYGTVPVVHHVGGLRDTVRHFDGNHDAGGTGWAFERAEADKFQWSLGQAIYTLRNHKESFAAIGVRGMQQDLGWDHAAYLYEQKFIEAKYAH